MTKLKLAVLAGGKSAEHTIALRSTSSILNNLDKSKYEISLIYIDRQSAWYNVDISTGVDIESLEKTFLEGDSSLFTRTNPTEALGDQEAAFPVIHGTYGEDGIVQGVLRDQDIAFVGCDVLGSAVGMDKELCKRIVRDSGIDIADFVTLYSNRKDQFTYQEVSDKLGTPIFVKPANAGSSVGVHKVESEDEFNGAIEDAFRYDKKIIIEEAVIGQEIECAVLGNEDPKASTIGEIVPTKDFYSYDAKYIDGDGADLLIPANLSEDQMQSVKEVAIKVFTSLCCEGLSRVDFFYKSDGTIVFNEINTFPGFTNISMYPSLWQDSGMPYNELLDALISLALERKKRDDNLSVDYR